MLKTTIGQLVVNHGLPNDLRDYSRVLDKKGIEKLLQQVAEKYPDLYREVAQHLATVGHHTAFLTGGQSFGPEDLRVSLAGRRAQQELGAKVRQLFTDPNLSQDQKEQKVVELMSGESDKRTQEVLGESLAEHNPLAFQVLSGARGNALNLRSLRGVGDLLYVDNRGRPIPVPILRNYSQGLSPAEYFAGAFGARKGVVDTKMAVAEAGFACLTGGTAVRMADGSTKPIVAVRPGDLVLGADRDGRVFPVRVARRFDNGIRTVWRYRFRDGKSRSGFVELEATEDHRVLALMKRGREGTKHGDKNSILTPTKLPLRRASRGFRMVIPQGSLSEAGRRESRAWVLGLLLGDGGISGHNVNFSNADPVLLAAVSADLTSQGFSLKPLKNHKYEYSIGDVQSLPYSRGYRHRLRAWLAELGLSGKKAPDKFIPACVDAWDDASVANLLAGVFNTDGWIHLLETSTVPVVGLTMTSLAIVAKVRDLLLFRFGVACPPVRRTVRKNPAERDQYTIAINDRRSVVRFAESIPLVGDRAAKLRGLLAGMKPRVRNDEYTYSFVGKEPLGNLPTYDLEVDHPDHLFVLGNGMIVSNSKQFNQMAHRLVVAGLDFDGDGEPDVGPRGLPVKTSDPDNEGALLAQDVGPYKKNTVLTPKVLSDLVGRGFARLLVRSPTVGGHPNGGLYARDVGVREKGGLPPTGDFVGLAASQALSEPLTQAQLCLAEGTLVRMADGSAKPIEGVKAGDEVVAVGFFAQNKGPTRVVAVHANGVKPCVRYGFTLYGRGGCDEKVGDLVCTEDHKVLRDCNDREDWQNVAAGSAFNLIPMRDWSKGVALWLDRDDAHPAQPHRAFRWEANDYVYLAEVEFVGDLPTYDITVADPDHMFLLANGLVVSNSSKHSGGVAAASASLSGFDLINQLVQVPSVFKGGAAHAQQDGRVTAIRPAPQGGLYVSVGGKDHYVGVGHDPVVKVGDDVEAGDVLSDGTPNPAEVVRHKGIGDGKRAFVEMFHKAYKDSGMAGHRRNIEVLARGLIDHVELDDEWEEHVPGDVVSYSRLEHKWRPRDDHSVVPVAKAGGHYLERPVLHYSIGTHVRPSVVRTLNEFGVKNVAVHKDPPPFRPVMIRGLENLSHDEDWMTRFLGSYLKKNFLRGVHRGETSDERGTSYVPSLARSQDFGKHGPVRSYKVDTPLPTPPKPHPSILSQMKAAAAIPREAPRLFVNRRQADDLVRWAEDEVFGKFKAEHQAGERRELAGEDDDYPLKEFTYPVACGPLPGFKAEGGGDLLLFQGTDDGGESGSFRVRLPEGFRQETRFYRHLSPAEKNLLLRSLAPVLAGPPEPHANLLEALEKFRS